MTEQYLNAQQQKAVQTALETHLQRILQDVNLRKWAVDVVLSNAKDLVRNDAQAIIELAERVHGFVAQPIDKPQHE